MAGRTNEVSMSYVEEASLATLPGSPTWKYLEPNDISSYGATTTTKARNPISDSRGAKKGAIVDLDSAVEFGCDLTMDSFYDFAKGLFFASWKTQLNFEPTAVTTSAFTVGASGDLDAGALVYARNFTNSANNGLHIVDTGATATSIAVTSTLTAETTPPDNAEVDVVGVQAGSGDLVIDSDGNLTSTTLDFTTLGLTQGQGIYIGGGTTDTDFATAAGGYAICKIIEANKITLDEVKTTDQTADTGTGKTIQIFFGHFVRDVATSDGDFASQSYQFEMKIPNLDEGTSYEYAKGNYCNSASFSIPTADLITSSFSFIGTDTPVPTTSRATGSWESPSLTTAMSGTSDVNAIRIQKKDGTSLASYTKSMDIEINNNVTAEKVVGVLGAVDIPYGDFSVTGSTEVLYENDDIVNVVRNNDTVTLDFIIKNTDGAIWLDIPSLTFGSGSKTFAENETIKIGIDANAFEDDYYGYSIGATWFPYVPA